MSDSEAQLRSTVETWLRAATNMIGLDLLKTSKYRLEQELYGTPKIQEILDSRLFREKSMDFFNNSLVRSYLDSVPGGTELEQAARSKLLNCPLRNILEEFLSRAQLQMDLDGALSGMLTELVQMLCSNTFDVKSFTIMQNFRSQRDTMEIRSARLTVRKLTAEHLFTPYHDFLDRTGNMFDGYNISTVYYVAETPIDRFLLDDVPDPTAQPFPTFHRCLKLISSVPVSISSIYYVPTGAQWHPFWSAKATRSSDVGSVREINNKFNFDEQDLAKCEALFAQYDAKREQLPRTSKKRFDLAMDKYIEADYHSDGLLEIVMAFEAALLPGIDAELRFRLAQRAALLIGSTQGERQDVFQNMKNIYDLRSKIVHGVVDPRANYEQSRELGKKAREYLRRCLCCLLDVTEADLGNYLDNLALD